VPIDALGISRDDRLATLEEPRRTHVRLDVMHSLTARVTSMLAAGGALLLTPALAFADAGPKCGCTIDSASAGAGALLASAVTLFFVTRRRRG
jgi:MYXO-CTERM domain-containing protein